MDFSVEMVRVAPLASTVAPAVQPGRCFEVVSWSCQSLVFVDGSHSMSTGRDFFFSVGKRWMVGHG